MVIKLIKSKTSEAQSLLNIQKNVFQDDLKKYQDYESSPATESLEFFKHRMNHSIHYTIFVDGKMAGGVSIVTMTDSHYYLFRIFFSRDYQNKGLGTKIMNEIERMFPKVKTWSLDTPQDNVRNRHFYEKLGYRETGKHHINSRLTLIQYEKKVKRL